MTFTSPNSYNFLSQVLVIYLVISYFHYFIVFTVGLAIFCLAERNSSLVL